jgi:hypothetical protein
MALTLHGTVADNTAVLDRRSAKPIIINGDMAVAQRGTSTTGITGGGYHTIDRMKVDLSDNGTWTHTQDTDVPTGQGFANSWKLDCTTADTSVASGTFHLARYLFEGQDLQLLKKGTSSAEKVTVSFWIKATVTGTYVAELFDTDNSRQISQAYTVSSANTWEKKVLSFVADTTGALGDDNGSSFAVNLWLGAGSDFSSGTLSTTWTSSTNANRAVGQVNSASSTDNNVYLTGLQMEVGEFDADSIASFQHESFGDSLVRCQRYCQTWTADNTNDIFCTGMSYSTTNWLVNLQMKNTMRTPPSLTLSAAARFYVHNNVAGAIACATIVGTNLTNNTGMIIGTVASGLVAGNATNLLAQGSDSKITATAEL